jgi:hypothetical protein
MEISLRARGGSSRLGSFKAVLSDRLVAPGRDMVAAARKKIPAFNAAICHYEGYACHCDDTPSLRGAQRRSNPVLAAVGALLPMHQEWIASLRSQ